MDELTALRLRAQQQARELEVQRALIGRILEIANRQQSEIDRLNELVLRTNQRLNFWRDQKEYMLKARWN